MTSTFYRDLEPLSAFSEASDDSAFKPVPGDWWVVVTDIIQSTRAIEDGRYRDVNTVGAMALAALQAELPDLLFPFSFGGDGSIALIPPTAREPAMKVLAGLPDLARRRFDLGLRVGLVPVQTLQDAGDMILVGKFQLENGYPLALFRGTGTRRAEAMLKEGTALSVDSHVGATPDLSQLMCLWQPIPSSRGTVLCLLVDTDPANQRRVLAAISAVLDDQLSRADPIHIDAMSFTPLGRLLAQERRYQDALGPYLRRVLVAVVMWLLCGTRLHQVFPALRAYLADFHADSDYRKLGPMLSMVLDCTLHEAEAIEACLARFQEEAGIDYGLHRSGHCLMTCFVPSPDQGGHVALVDGGDGGYAMAAKALKKTRDRPPADEEP